MHLNFMSNTVKSVQPAGPKVKRASSQPAKALRLTLPERPPNSKLCLSTPSKKPVQQAGFFTTHFPLKTLLNKNILCYKRVAFKKRHHKKITIFGLFYTVLIIMIKFCK